MIIEWNDDELLNKVNDIIEVATRDGANMVAKDARSLCPWETGALATSIEVKKSRFKDGGYMVVAQGPNNYERFYATFVELGTHDTKAQPYLRPALHKNKNRISRMYENRIR